KRRRGGSWPGALSWATDARCGRRTIGGACQPGRNRERAGPPRHYRRRPACDKHRLSRPQRVAATTAAGGRRLHRLGVLAYRRARRRYARTPKIGRDTSELQSHLNLVCRLLLEKKKKNTEE